MKRVLCVLPIVVLGATVAFSQQGGGQKIGLATSLQRSYAGLKGNLTGEAEKMPEADYGSKPSSMPEVRTFGQAIAHVAQAQFGACAVVKGVPSPVQGKNLEQELKTKADLVKTLADSFSFCDDAFAQTTDENATQFVKQGMNEVTRAAVLFSLIAHSNEMYGTGAVYLRAKGIVPPSTERQNMGRGRGN